MKCCPVQVHEKFNPGISQENGDNTIGKIRRQANE
jgi:hypothetical protein